MDIFLGHHLTVLNRMNTLNLLTQSPTKIKAFWLFLFLFFLSQTLSQPNSEQIHGLTQALANLTKVLRSFIIICWHEWPDGILKGTLPF